MSLEYVLDITVLSEPLRPQPARRVLEWIEEHRWKAAFDGLKIEEMPVTSR